MGNPFDETAKIELRKPQPRWILWAKDHESEVLAFILGCGVALILASFFV